MQMIQVDRYDLLLCPHFGPEMYRNHKIQWKVSPCPNNTDVTQWSCKESVHVFSQHFTLKEHSSDTSSRDRLAKVAW